MEEKILVGLDDSEESWNAFDFATLEVKNKNLEKITVVHSEVGGRSKGPRQYRAGEEILERARSLGKEEGVEVETRLLIRGADPENDIVKYAEEKDFNHIIIGHRGRSGISRVFLGGVAEAVVERAHCIVTVVRAAPFIRRAGGRIEPREIERLLDQHEGVVRSAVMGVFDKKVEKLTDFVMPEENYEQLVAFVVSGEKYELKKEMIRSHMGRFVKEGRIENYEVPDRVEILDKMPETDAGTIDREALKRKYS